MFTAEPYSILQLLLLSVQAVGGRLSRYSKGRYVPLFSVVPEPPWSNLSWILMGIVGSVYVYKRLHQSTLFLFLPHIWPSTILGASASLVFANSAVQFPLLFLDFFYPPNFPNPVCLVLPSARQPGEVSAHCARQRWFWSVLCIFWNLVDIFSVVITSPILFVLVGLHSAVISVVWDESVVNITVHTYHVQQEDLWLLWETFCFLLHMGFQHLHLVF